MFVVLAVERHTPVEPHGAVIPGLTLLGKSRLKEGHWTITRETFGYFRVIDSSSISSPLKLCFSNKNLIGLCHFVYFFTSLSSSAFGKL